MKASKQLLNPNNEKTLNILKENKFNSLFKRTLSIFTSSFFIRIGDLFEGKIQFSFSNNTKSINLLSPQKSSGSSKVHLLFLQAGQTRSFLKVLEF